MQLSLHSTTYTLRIGCDGAISVYSDSGAKLSLDEIRSLQIWCHAQLNRKVVIEYELFRQAYNNNKPRLFSKLNKFSDKRRYKIDKLVAEFDGNQYEALKHFTQALLQISKQSENPSDWWYGKELNFDNFLTNDKILKFSEKWETQEEIRKANQLVIEQAQQEKEEERKNLITKESLEAVRERLKRYA